MSNSHLHSPNNGHGAPPTHSSSGARDPHPTHNPYPDYNGGIESRMVRNSNQNQSQAPPPTQPPSQDTFNLPPNAKSCRSQNLQYPDKCYTNQEPFLKIKQVGQRESEIYFEMNERNQQTY